MELNLDRQRQWLRGRVAGRAAGRITVRVPVQSPRVSVEVSLSKTLTEPLTAPDEQLGALHGFLLHQCVNVMHSLCKVLKSSI